MTENGQAARPISLASAVPTRAHQAAALGVVAVLVIAFAITAAFDTIQLGRLNAFIPSVGAVIFVTDLATAAVLYDQFSTTRRFSVVMLATGYLVSALIGIPYALTFPGAFAPGPLFGGMQTSTWLYLFWHVSFPVVVLSFALLKDRVAPMTSSAAAIGWSIALSVGLVVVVTWIAVDADRLLFPLFNDDMHANGWVRVIAALCASTAAAALAVLWRRHTSILDLWLMVAIVAAIIEPILLGLIPTSRFSVGFYASRAYSVVISTVVLGALLAETGALYRTISDTAAHLERERENKLMTIEAVVASIVHEVRQPLSAIATNAEACLLLLNCPSLDREETRAALEAITQDTCCINGILSDLQGLFKTTSDQVVAVDINATIRHALRIAYCDLKGTGIAVSTALAPELPLAAAHESEMLQVLLNLVRNAMDAMTTADHPRHLHLSTELSDDRTIAVSIKDSGGGVSPERIDQIFDPFMTTKTGGMGLGLPICRTILQRRGGGISVANDDAGAVFRVVLPSVGQAAPALHVEREAAISVPSAIGVLPEVDSASD